MQKRKRLRPWRWVTRGGALFWKGVGMMFEACVSALVGETA